MTDLSSDAVLQREQSFFDEEARGLDDAELRIAEDQIARYRNAQSRPMNTSKDALFASLLPIEGKRVLDYGCGTGDLACELALCGANVTAFDLSPESIAKARRRAEIHGIAHRIQFDVRAANATEYPDASFDILTGSAILHHLHTELPQIYAEVDRVLAPRATACFLEPVSNSATLRFLRRLVPVKSHATPDERQLFYSDFEPLRRYFTTVEFHHFYCLERLTRVLGDKVNKPCRWLDYHAQRVLPFLRHYYGIVLVIARR
jgi:ubiquinone/menaquinone biosynthesis C-methylase UbiE